VTRSHETERKARERTARAAPIGYAQVKTLRARCKVCGGLFLYKPPMTWHWHGKLHEKRCTGELERVK
jgi:hypothetical protein